MRSQMNEQDQIAVAELLGREPRGLEAVAVRDKHGVPVVIRVAPLIGKKPFPTLYWLVDKRLNYAIDQLEARGIIAQLQEVVDQDQSLQAQLADDHQRYIQARLGFMSEAMRGCIDTLGYTEVLSQRGIGGIADFQRIRCLHTYYAAHLVETNAVGQMVDQIWDEQHIEFNHLKR